MQSLKRSDEGLFTIVIEEVNAKLIVSWKGDILEARKNIHKNELVECLYININDELLKIIEMHDASATVTTANRNKIPLYYRRIGNKHCISNSVYCLVNKNDTIALDAVCLASILMSIGNPKAYLIDLFRDIKLLKSSSIYTIYNGKIEYKKNFYSQYFNNTNYTNKNDLIELLAHKYECLCKNYANIHLFLSAGYDSRLELALLINPIKKYKNRVILHHYSTFGLEHDIALSVAKYYNFDIVVYNEAYLYQRGLVNFTNDERVSKYNSGPFQLGLYFTLEALNSVKENKDDVFLVNSIGELKGKYYPDVKNLLHVGVQDFERIRSKLNSNITYNDYLLRRQNVLDDVTNDLKDIQDRYAKLDILHATVLDSNLFGKRLHTLMMLRNCAFPMEDDTIWLMFANLRRKDKEGSNFVRYAIRGLEKRLDDYKYQSSGDLYKFTGYQLVRYIYKGLTSCQLIFPNKKSNDAIDISAISLSMIKNDDVRSEILEAIRNGIIGSSIESSLYSLQTFKFLRMLEKDFNCNFELV
jgi:hypothetical protein